MRVCTQLLRIGRVSVAAACVWARCKVAASLRRAAEPRVAKPTSVHGTQGWTADDHTSVRATSNRYTWGPRTVPPGMLMVRSARFVVWRWSPAAHAPAHRFAMPIAAPGSPIEPRFFLCSTGVCGGSAVDRPLNRIWPSSLIDSRPHANIHDQQKRCLATTGTTRSTRTCGAFFRRRTSSVVPSSSTGLFGARAASSTNSRSGWRVSQQGGFGAFGIARHRLSTSIVLCHDRHTGTSVRGRGRMGEARSKLHAVR